MLQNIDPAAMQVPLFTTATPDENVPTSVILPLDCGKVATGVKCYPTPQFISFQMNSRASYHLLSGLPAGSYGQGFASLLHLSSFRNERFRPCQTPAPRSARCQPNMRRSMCPGLANVYPARTQGKGRLSPLSALCLAEWQTVFPLYGFRLMTDVVTHSIPESSPHVVRQSALALNENECASVFTSGLDPM